MKYPIMTLAETIKADGLTLSDPIRLSIHDVSHAAWQTCAVAEIPAEYLDRPCIKTISGDVYIVDMRL